MRKVSLFVNPLLTGTRQTTAIASVEAVLRGAGVRHTTTLLGAPESATRLVRAAIADGCDAIFVCGGDGTIHALLEALAGTGVPLGVVPMGTGNVLAQNLRLPRHPAEAARALLRGRPRQAILGKVAHTGPDGKAATYYFATAAGLGCHARLMNAAEHWGKHLHGRAAYYFAGIDLLLRHRIEPFEFEISTIDGQTFTQQASELLAVRVPELNRWLPGGDMHKPVLRVAVTGASTGWELGQASFGALARTRPPGLSVPPDLSRSKPSASPAEVRYYDAVRVACRPVPGHSYKAPVLLQADGEVLGESSAVFSLADETLTLLWPEH